MEDMKGVTVLITGSTAGLGLHTAKSLYLRGATVIITCRDEVRGRRALEEIITLSASDRGDEIKDQYRVHLYSLDLTSYRSVINFTEEVSRDFSSIDVIINNAGVMGMAFELSSNGVEMHFATNVFGHYVMINRLLPLLAKSRWTGGARIVVVSSGLYRNTVATPSAKQLMGEKHWEYTSQQAYAFSKLANCLYTVALNSLIARKELKIGVYCMRPGFVRGTDLGRETHWILRALSYPAIWLFSKDLNAGIDTIVYLASTANEQLESGKMYNDRRVEEYASTVDENSARNLCATLFYIEEMIWKRDQSLTETEIEASKAAREYLISDMEDELSTLIPEAPSIRTSTSRRNFVGFWLLGLCNNFAYVIMLSAAKDILDSGEVPGNSTNVQCREHIVSRECQPISTGSVLLADIIPALVVKVSAPFFIHVFPFGVRHLIVVFLQSASFALVGLSSSTGVALLGVVLASAGSGLGEISYLALTSHFDGFSFPKTEKLCKFRLLRRFPVRSFPPGRLGTGGAGVFGALFYALLTDPLLLDVSPKNAMFVMLLLPALFSFTYWKVLTMPSTVHQVDFRDLRSFVVSRDLGRRGLTDETDTLLAGDEFDDELGPGEERVHELSYHQKTRLLLRLLKYMLPLTIVYFGEYFINQGLMELLEFDCSHGFGLGSNSQYRWFQVTYQLGVFVSRSSSQYFTIPSSVLPLLATLQLTNGAVFTSAALYFFLPHILVAFALIFYEGLLGGAAYVNTFRAVHSEIPMAQREFSMGFVSISDTIGIVFAGFLAIPAHNIICRQKLFI
ncbi:unnamed protein product [Caenorhabditis auriculariae]|uniref:Battenin n=1 Tax=Caenorhabditis auriculariae TaxID=2777116 RepID=A0A8S1HIK6_9PELO|nr:unnamed protein product [Caenorhabditis auriculariae]